MKGKFKKLLFVALIALVAALFMAACEDDGKQGGAGEKPEQSGYTVTFVANNAEYGSLSRATLENVPENAAVVADGNMITIDGKEITATPLYPDETHAYFFESWSDVPSAVTENVTVTANFSVYEITGLSDYHIAKGTETYDFKSGITVTENGEDLDFTVDHSEIDFDVPGEYTVKFSVVHGEKSRLIKVAAAHVDGITVGNVKTDYYLYDRIVYPSFEVHSAVAEPIIKTYLGGVEFTENDLPELSAVGEHELKIVCGETEGAETYSESVTVNVSGIGCSSNLVEGITVGKVVSVEDIYYINDPSAEASGVKIKMPDGSEETLSGTKTRSLEKPGYYKFDALLKKGTHDISVSGNEFYVGFDDEIYSFEEPTATNPRTGMDVSHTGGEVTKNLSVIEINDNAQYVYAGRKSLSIKFNGVGAGFPATANWVDGDTIGLPGSVNTAKFMVYCEKAAKIEFAVAMSGNGTGDENWWMLHHGNDPWRTFTTAAGEWKEIVLPLNRQTSPNSNLNTLRFLNVDGGSPLTIYIDSVRFYNDTTILTMDSFEFETGESADITGGYRLFFGDGYNITYSAERGSVSDSGVYTAPADPCDDTVTVTATNAGGDRVRSTEISVKVVAAKYHPQTDEIFSFEDADGGYQDSYTVTRCTAEVSEAHASFGKYSLKVVPTENKWAYIGFTKAYEVPECWQAKIDVYAESAGTWKFSIYQSTSGPSFTFSNDAANWLTDTAGVAVALVAGWNKDIVINFNKMPWSAIGGGTSALAMSGTAGSAIYIDNVRFVSHEYTRQDGEMIDFEGVRSGACSYYSVNSSTNMLSVNTDPEFVKFGKASLKVDLTSATRATIQLYTDNKNTPKMAQKTKLKMWVYSSVACTVRFAPATNDNNTYFLNNPDTGTNTELAAGWNDVELTVPQTSETAYLATLLVDRVSDNSNQVLYVDCIRAE